VPSLPTYTESVSQRILIEPLESSHDVFYYMRRFPEELYLKSPDSRLWKYMQTLLGAQGVGFIKQNHFEARLLFEELGIEMFSLDRFFGDPFGFGRILDEQFEDDPTGLLDWDKWQEVKAQNARYRNRALQYVNGLRAGNTPLGMQQAAKSGLGHNVEIIENYKFLFDVHSDDPIGLKYYGRTGSTEEMIVLPAREVAMSEEQVISIGAYPELPNGGGFAFLYNGNRTINFPYTYDDGTGPVVRYFVPWNGTADHVRLALEALPGIGTGNVEAVGGPLPSFPITVRFVNLLSNVDVPELQMEQAANPVGFYGDPNVPGTLDTSNNITLNVTTTQSGQSSVDETVTIPDNAKWNLQQAIDRLRPQTTIMTVAENNGLRSRLDWGTNYSTSQYTEVVRYVTGTGAVRWPTTNPWEWIRQEQEKAGPRVANQLRYSYSGFHTVTNVESSSVYAGLTDVFSADRALADYSEPLLITSSTEIQGESVSFVNDIYPESYRRLSGIPPIKYNYEQLWASAERPEDESITLSFAFAEAVNYISFEMLRDPVQVDVEFDANADPEFLWTPVTPVEPYNNISLPTVELVENNWISIGLAFTNRLDQIIFTQSLRINFTRLQNYTGKISVRNLRVGRNIS
jgi:hypothetical protein